MRNIQPLAIFSVDRPDTPPAALEAQRDRVRDMLNKVGYSFAECAGRWEGETEHSFAVSLPVPLSKCDEALIAACCAHHEQDAYVIVSGSGAAALHTWDPAASAYSTGEYIGQWRAARSEEEAESLGAWTKDLSTGTKYVIV